jgi:large subunit ribosomal protein L15
MVTLNKLFPKCGSRKSKKRLGLGIASGIGRSSGKGMKGQTSRSGNTKKESKEGGQMILARRVPKSGFSNVKFAKKYDYVNIGALDKSFKSGAEVNPEALEQKGLIKNWDRVKVLGMGEIKNSLKVTAHAFSKSAKEKIEKAGGSVTAIEK